MSVAYHSFIVCETPVTKVYSLNYGLLFVSPCCLPPLRWQLGWLWKRSVWAHLLRHGKRTELSYCLPLTLPYPMIRFSPQLFWNIQTALLNLSRALPAHQGGPQLSFPQTTVAMLNWLRWWYPPSPSPHSSRLGTPLPNESFSVLPSLGYCLFILPLCRPGLMSPTPAQWDMKALPMDSHSAVL